VYGFVLGTVCDFFVFLFVYEISLEPLNRFVPDSQGRRVWFLAQTNLNARVKGQGHQGKKRPFSAGCVRFMFGKTSFALVLI